jgi:hypothetical protein
MTLGNLLETSDTSNSNYGKSNRYFHYSDPKVFGLSPAKKVPKMNFSTNFTTLSFSTPI